jgi:murein DD-endopeptidase MepM/ murein hydrolase activator NlpD
LTETGTPQHRTPTQATTARATSPLFARAVTYGIVILLGGIAVVFTPPLRDKPPVVAAVLSAPSRGPVWRQRHDTLARGETLSALLERAGIRGQHAANILRSATSLDERRVPAGLALTVRTLDSDTLPSELIFQLAIDRILTVRRSDTGWVSSEEKLPWTTDTIAVRGKITSTLYDALDAADSDLPAGLAGGVGMGARGHLRVSRRHEPRSADRRCLPRPRRAATRSAGCRAVRRHPRVDIHRCRLRAPGHPPSTRGHAAGYYDQDGKSMRAAFLRAPLEFRRISSVFGMRKHPILGIWRRHAGTDYAASQGTPVRSVGDGVVIFAGRKGGYGNVLEVRHRNGFVTRYGHLRAFAKVARRGARVEIGQTIGYVGMTGLATAPHLHFEVLVGGAQRNPRVALAMKGGEPLPTSERNAFAQTRGDLIALLERETSPARLAARP